MGSLLVVLFLSLFYSQCLGAEEVNGYPPSVNCVKEGNCPPYKVVHSQKEFEIRMYENSTWLFSSFKTISYNVAFNAGYINVLKYFRGFSLDDTQPVLTDIIPNTDYDSLYKVYLYVPKELQNYSFPPPEMGESIAMPVKLPRRKLAAVIRFDGHLEDTIIAAKLAALKTSLKGTPWQSAATSSDYSAADYQLFYQKNNRVNEIILWFDN